MNHKQPANQAVNCTAGNCTCESSESGTNQSQSQGVPASAVMGLMNTGTGSPLMAGPFDPIAAGSDEGPIPADKKLSENWVRSLYERGEPEWVCRQNLGYIGLPIGGLCCGQVYLSGDGRLWHWDIFNEGISTRGDGSHYATPMTPAPAIDLDVRIRTRVDGKTSVHPLDASGFPDLKFRGAYPIGFVEYASDACPVLVSLEAFSPFLPLDVEASSLPLTVLRYTVRNPSQLPVEVTLSIAMSNPVLHRTGIDEAVLINTARRQPGLTAIHYSAESVPSGTETIAANRISDQPRKPAVPLKERHDYGDMTLAILDDGEGVFSNAEIPANDAEHCKARFDAGVQTSRQEMRRPRAAVGKTIKLAPGESFTCTFVVSWRFNNLTLAVDKDEPPETGNYYANRFASSFAAVAHLATSKGWYESTRLWHDTWYDSTLPYWLLDRTFINVSTLATRTCFRFTNGRFYAFEGVGCCEGTCTHVWHYAQSMGRIFPELERITRERVDYGVAYQPDGCIWYRAGMGKHEAIDGHCGTILRVYREHTMSSTAEFLKRIWPRVKQSILFLIGQEGGESGVLTGKQMNTLDSAWYGPISWISSLYLACLRAGALMAQEMGDPDFAKRCEQILSRGSAHLVDHLFNGEYFYHRRDPKYPEAIGAGTGCLIDQAFGQGWAHQLALGRVLPEDKTKTALTSLYRYNFAPDVGPYRKAHTHGRWFAKAGEAGLLMCTFPRGGMDAAGGGQAGRGFAGYFNECMTGFEYQAAWHMISEGLVQEGLAVTRAIHDRYHPSRRNPYNEIECGDHYARAMASHGVFISVCGFEVHGPKGHIGFAPKITPEHFRAPFIAAEGWGTFDQKIDQTSQRASLHLKWGRLVTKIISLEIPSGRTAAGVALQLDGRDVAADLKMDGRRATIELRQPVTIDHGKALSLHLKFDTAQRS